MNKEEIFKYREQFTSKILNKFRLLMDLDLDDKINLSELITDMIANNDKTNSLKLITGYKNTNIFIYDECLKVKKSDCFKFSRNFLDNLYISNKLLLHKYETKYKVLDIVPDYLRLSFSHRFATAAAYKNKNIQIVDYIKLDTSNKNIKFNTHSSTKNIDIITIQPLFSPVQYEDLNDLNLYLENIFSLFNFISTCINKKTNKIIFICGGLSYSPTIIQLCESLLVYKVINKYNLHVNEEPIIYNYNRDLMYIELVDFQVKIYDDLKINVIINHIIKSNYKIYSNENYIKCLNLYLNKYKIINDEFKNILTKNQLINFLEDSMVNYGLMVGLQVHPEYLIKYQFKTWTAILNKYLKKKTDINILELGCYKGVSTVYFLKNIIGSEPTNFIDCVDTWEGSVEYDTYGEDVYKTFHKVTSMMGNFSQVGIHKMRTYNYLINYNSKKLKKDYKLYDIVFIDASHDARDVIRDLLLSWEILNVGGIIICDDYMWKKQPEDYERPKLAIDSFLYMFRDNLEVISKKYQLIFRKLKHY